MRPLTVAALATFAACDPHFTLTVIQSPPNVMYTSPEDGSAFDEGEIVDIRLLVGDATDPAESLTLVWTDSRDGQLDATTPIAEDGTAELLTNTLSVGGHTLTARVVDLDGQMAEARLLLEIRDLPDAPEITIVRPILHDVAYDGEDFELVALVSDDRDAPDSMTLYIDSSLDGPVCDAMIDTLGEARCVVRLRAGDHELTFHAADSEGNEGSSAVRLHVSTGGEVDNDGDGFSERQGDCDDTNSAVRPGAVELCNGIDDNCTNGTDEGVGSAWYVDDDGDGYGASTRNPISACARPAGYADRGGDCDDRQSRVNPGSNETCNSVDDDCDGAIDEGLAATYYADRDGDGWGSGLSPQQACSRPAGTAERAGDCDDNRASTNPSATEVCNSVDDDCDGSIDEGMGSTWYRDADGDGDGNSGAYTQSCSQPSGYTSRGGDCDDGRSSVHPGSNESCNGLDDDCDGSTDEGVGSTYYRDGDGDGYGSNTTISACSQPSGYVTNHSDCYDGNSRAYPGSNAGYNTQHRGDGSFDYDCDGVISYQYNRSSGWGCDGESDFFGSDVWWNEGWVTTPGPDCGASADWATSCDYDVYPWYVEINGPAGISRRTQACK
ncbi:MAG TPA: putative metal-binding motif-containing protein [Myxococcota bacterium]|nr:putative metal-binding motif-containing protein [Myxococcota bacterium]